MATERNRTPSAESAPTSFETTDARGSLEKATVKGHPFLSFRHLGSVRLRAPGDDERTLLDLGVPPAIVAITTKAYCNWKSVAAAVSLCS
eukprot:1753542-Amphidinium_carterae.1